MNEIQKLKNELAYEKKISKWKLDLTHTLFYIILVLIGIAYLSSVSALTIVNDDKIETTGNIFAKSVLADTFEGYLDYDYLTGVPDFLLSSELDLNPYLNQTQINLLLANLTNFFGILFFETTQTNADNYSTIGFWTNTNRVYDGNWNTYGFGSGTGSFENRTSYMDIIYFKPDLNLNRELTKWEVKSHENIGDVYRYNLTIREDCWNYHPSTLYLRVMSRGGDGGGVEWTCYNGTSYPVLASQYNARGVFEDSMHWAYDINVTASNLNFSELNISGDYDDTWINQTFFNKTEILNFNYYNSSDFDITDYFTKTEILNFNYYNSSDFDISDYFTKTEILNFDYYNSSDFDINDYLLVSNWNATNTSYYLASNPLNFLNETTLNLTSTNYWSKSGDDLYYNDGSVGIGTTSPLTKLHVNGNAIINGTLIGLSNATDLTGAVTLAQLQAVNTSATASETDPFWSGNFSNVLKSNDNNNLIIGDNPNLTLWDLDTGFSTATAFIKFGESGGAEPPTLDNHWTIGYEGSDFTFKWNGVERAVLTSTGRLGLGGVSTPSYDLHVGGTGRFSSTLSASEISSDGTVAGNSGYFSLSSSDFIISPDSVSADRETGFFYIPVTDDVPSGFPSGGEGRSFPMTYDSSNHQLCVYDIAETAWYCVAMGGI